MCAKKADRKLHDAFENDVDLDLSPEALEENEAAPEAVAEARRELIERLPADQMVPDRFQPRPVLPLDLHQQFFAGELDPYETAAAWLERAENEAGHRARVTELMRMAESVDEHGQIKPITGAWRAAEGGGYQFHIETGERRYWGAVLRHVKVGRDGQPELRVEAVEAPSVERQIVENRHAEPPTAVAQAREIAAVVLKRLEIEPDPEEDDPYAFFRQALDPPGRERLPRGIWSDLEPMMQLSPRRMRQVLNVLQLPTPLLERADLYNLSDRVLQRVLAEPAELWEPLIKAAIEDELTGEGIKEAAEELREGQPDKNRARRKTPDHSRSALRGLRGFTGALSRAGEKKRGHVLDEVADEIVIQDDAASVLDVMEELISLVRTRLEALETQD